MFEYAIPLICLLLVPFVIIDCFCSRLFVTCIAYLFVETIHCSEVLHSIWLSIRYSLQSVLFEVETACHVFNCTIQWICFFITAIYCLLILEEQCSALRFLFNQVGIISPLGNLNRPVIKYWMTVNNFVLLIRSDYLAHFCNLEQCLNFIFLLQCMQQFSWAVFCPCICVAIVVL